jgi:hypothetical protein
LRASTPAEAHLRTAALRLKSALAAAEVIAAGTRVLALLGKANFDPNQPRVPRGNPDGGQWTHVGGGSADPAQPRLAADEPPPEIPKDRPPRASLRWPVVREVARWVLFIGLQETPVGPILDVIQAAQWIYEYAPYVQAYVDGPKTLEELQSATSEPKGGYDVHHMVERTPALNDGFSTAKVDAPENLVRIPTLKHWQINGWYSAKNEDFGYLTPRAHLRGKSWEERMAVGKFALKKFGVLQP